MFKQQMHETKKISTGQSVSATSYASPQHAENSPRTLPKTISKTTGAPKMLAKIDFGAFRMLQDAPVMLRLLERAGGILKTLPRHARTHLDSRAFEKVPRSPPSNLERCQLHIVLAVVGRHAPRLMCLSVTINVFQAKRCKSRTSGDGTVLRGFFEIEARARQRATISEKFG